MRKETGVAIVIGVIFGLVVAFGIWRANSAISERVEIATESESYPSVTPSGLLETSEGQKLVSFPKTNFVSANETVEFTGKTIVGSILIISTSTDDQIFLTEKDGSFKRNVKLASGVNQVITTSIDRDKKADTQVNIIVYSPGIKFEDQVADENISEKVAKRIDQVADYPISYLGIITDKTDNSLQIKNTDGIIQLVATDEKTTYSQDISTKKTINFSDLAIGDFCAALGLETKRGVLEAERVLITSPLKESTRKVIYGVVTLIKGRQVTVKDSSDIEWVLNFPSKWVGPEIKDLNEGVEVIFIGEPDADEPENISVRTISLIPNPSPTLTPTNKPNSSPTPSAKLSPTKKVTASPSPTPKN